MDKIFFKNDYPYKNSINAVGNRSDEQFKDFFTKVEIEELSENHKLTIFGKIMLA